MALVTFTKLDVRKLLALPDKQAVETLIDLRVLQASAYDAKGRPLFSADDVRRAAEYVFNTPDPLDQLRRRYAKTVPRAAAATDIRDLVAILCKEKKYREGGDDRSIFTAVLDDDPLLKALYAK
jgi:hypothetical protein